MLGLSRNFVFSFEVIGSVFVYIKELLNGDDLDINLEC